MFSNLNDLHVSLMLCYCLKIHIGEEELKHWQIFVYCFMDGGFKHWSTLKHKYYLQNILYFQWMQLISAIPSNWKNIIKQNNDINAFTTTQHHFSRSSRVLTVQKETLKELHWILITTIDYKPTSQKCF